jgi:hypothetical protein
MDFFYRVLASHAGGPSLIPGRDMSVLGLLVQDGMTLVEFLHSGDPDVTCPV